jgi:type II secretory pathway component PulF
MMLIESFSRWFKLQPFRLDRAEFYSDLAEMFARGESMLGFLEGELANAKLTGQHSRAAALRIMLRRYVSGAAGGSLLFVLRTVMPAGDAMMLTAVDRAKDKAEALRAMAAAVELQAKMRRMVLAACIGPVLAAPLCITMIIVVSDVLRSTDRSTPIYIRDEVWSGFNAFAKLLADLSVAYGGTALTVFVAAVALAVYSLPRWTGHRRLRVDGWPIYSLYRDFQAGLVLSSLAMQLRAHLPLRSSIEDLAQDASPWVRWQISRVTRSLDEEPTAIVRAFGRGLLSPHLQARASTLNRKSKDFAEVLVQLGTSEGHRVLGRVKQTALAMNIAVMSVLGGVTVTLGLAAMTVPGDFATAMEPTSLMTSKRMYEQRATTDFVKPAVK